MHGMESTHGLSSTRIRSSGLHRLHNRNTASGSAPVAKRSLRRGAVALLVTAGLGLVATGAALRPWELLKSSHSVEVAAEAHAPRSVTVVSPMRETSGSVVLPATVQPWQSARLYGRVSGYVRAWHVEIGQSVQAGDVLAEIDTPELDQELAQAEADLQAARVAVAQAEAELAEGEAILKESEATLVRSQADLSLATKQLQRREHLVARQALTREDLDLAMRDQDARQAEVTAAEASVKRQSANIETRRAIIASRKAVVVSREANVQRLTQLQSFKNVEAPFPGVVTRRNAEVGALVLGGSNSGTALYEIAQLDRVRVQVAVPQGQAAGVSVGTPVVIRIPEVSGSKHAAQVTRTSESLDPTTRTLLVESELTGDRHLKPGLYAEAQFEVRSSSGQWLVPTSTLRMQVDGPHVVTADPEGRLTVVPVQLGRDHGSRVAIASGLTGDEQLVVNPTDDLRDGMKLTVLK